MATRTNPGQAPAAGTAGASDASTAKNPSTNTKATSADRCAESSGAGARQVHQRAGRSDSGRASSTGSMRSVPPTSTQAAAKQQQQQQVAVGKSKQTPPIPGLQQAALKLGPRLSAEAKALVQQQQQQQQSRANNLLLRANRNQQHAPEVGELGPSCQQLEQVVGEQRLIGDCEEAGAITETDQEEAEGEEEEEEEEPDDGCSCSNSSFDCLSDEHSISSPLEQPLLGPAGAHLHPVVQSLRRQPGSYPAQQIQLHSHLAPLHSHPPLEAHLHHHHHHHHQHNSHLHHRHSSSSSNTANNNNNNNHHHHLHHHHHQHRHQNQPLNNGNSPTSLYNAHLRQQPRDDCAFTAPGPHLAPRSAPAGLPAHDNFHLLSELASSPQRHTAASLHRPLLANASMPPMQLSAVPAAASASQPLQPSQQVSNLAGPLQQQQQQQPPLQSPAPPPPPPLVRHSTYTAGADTFTDQPLVRAAHHPIPIGPHRVSVTPPDGQISDQQFVQPAAAGQYFYEPSGAQTLQHRGGGSGGSQRSVIGQRQQQPGGRPPATGSSSSTFGRPAKFRDACPRWRPASGGLDSEVIQQQQVRGAELQERAQYSNNASGGQHNASNLYRHRPRPGAEGERRLLGSVSSAEQANNSGQKVNKSNVHTRQPSSTNQKAHLTTASSGGGGGRGDGFTSAPGANLAAYLANSPLPLSVAPTQFDFRTPSALSDAGSAGPLGARYHLFSGISPFDAVAFCPPARRLTHRTNSPWMRLSSIILMPIGLVIILFIVVSPLLHYLM